MANFKDKYTFTHPENGSTWGHDSLKEAKAAAKRFASRHGRSITIHKTASNHGRHISHIVKP